MKYLPLDVKESTYTSIVQTYAYVSINIKDYCCLITGILGPSRSQNTQKVLEMVENMDIPVVSPSSTSPDLRNSPNFFRTVPSDDDQVRVSIFYFNVASDILY